MISIKSLGIYPSIQSCLANSSLILVFELALHILPAIHASVSASPPNDTALRMQSSYE